VPLSLGIPAATVGVIRGGGAHTREEWVEVSSLAPGVDCALELMERIVCA
jgi:di/tripeptidase